MSASSKKKLRNEQNAAALTERQQQEIKEAKKLRTYTALFAIAIAVMLVVVVTTSVIESGIIQRSTTALTVGESKVSAAELNHYYVDTVNQYVQEAGDYISLFGIDTTVPLDEQYFNEEVGQTWADYFLEYAESSAQAMYAYYNAAKAEGYTLSAESLTTIESTVSNYALYATVYGMSTDGYIANIYGKGCNEDTLRHYAEVQLLASEYMNDKMESKEFTDEDLRAAEAENYGAYSAFTYNYYYLAASKFYEGGTTNEETGTTQYSDEEMAAGREAAKAVAESLLTATTADELDAAIAALEINAESTTAKSTRQEDYLYSNVPSAIREWVAGDRKAGDIDVIASEYTSTDADGNETKEVGGYYVVLFESADDNTRPLVNVRHILIAPEGGTYDSTTGTTTYTDEELAAAKSEAEALLASFLDGEATEEAFAQLAKDNSTDTGSVENGGLYEDVYPGQMVTSFNDWCFDESRKPGDTGVVESDYGYHVMYFSGNSETSYRDYMIEQELLTDYMTEFETQLIESNALTVKNTKYVQTDLVLDPEAAAAKATEPSETTEPTEAAVS